MEFGFRSDGWQLPQKVQIYGLECPPVDGVTRPPTDGRHDQVYGRIDRCCGRLWSHGVSFHRLPCSLVTQAGMRRAWRRSMVVLAGWP